MSWAVRRMEADDVAAVAALQRAAALRGFAHIFPAEAPEPTDDGLAAEWEERLARPDDAIYVATQWTAPVGVVIAGPDPQHPEIGHLAKLYVHPAHWAQGVGRRLHDVAVAELVARGFGAARLQVLERNERARAWYERLGWRPTGERAAMYEQYGIFEVVYARRLGDGPSVVSAP